MPRGQRVEDLTRGGSAAPQPAGYRPTDPWMPNEVANLETELRIILGTKSQYPAEAVPMFLN